MCRVQWNSKEGSMDLIMELKINQLFPIVDIHTNTELH